MVASAFLALSYILLANNPTTLVKPPFGHTMGYHRATPYELRMILGKSISFCEPQGIACCKLRATDDPKSSKDDDELTVYCANSRANQIVYNKTLRKLDAYGGLGSKTGEFWWPRGIAASPEGWVYVADVENHRVVRLRNDVDSLKWLGAIGSFGCDIGEFDTPWDLDIDSKERVWVVDRGNNRIQVFDQKGSFIKQITGFDSPVAVAVTDKGEYWSYYKSDFLIVVDEDGKRIQKCDLDGKVVASSGMPDCELSDCAIDYHDQIWVTDKLNGCIHKFDRHLSHITRVLRPDNSKFISPRAIAIWKRFGQVFIVEQEAIDYLWVGVDGYIEGCYPPIFDPREKGTTISIYLTEPARISGTICKDGNEIGDFLPVLKGEPFEHNIVWDGRDKNGKTVGPGEYEIKMTLEPTYSSRGYFKKELKATVVCEYKESPGGEER
jgi:hypothetical protein